LNRRLTAWDVGLPVLMMAVQVLVAPFVAEVDNQPFGGWDRIVGLFAHGACVFALVWRRFAPEAVTAVTVLIVSVSVLWLPELAVEGLIPPTLVALFSLAVQRETRVAVAGTALVTLTAFPVSLYDPPAEFVLNVVLTVGACVIFASIGQSRRRRVLRKNELADRLANAEQERRLAAAAERERLARDLHDVAGHHLSAVVVHASAAVRLAGTRPELAAESLGHAATTGREVLEALNRLVDVVGEGTEHGATLEELLPQLAEGLTRLGVPVSMEVEGKPVKLPGHVVDAVYRIVQESLTNAMRYGGGAVVVRLSFLEEELRTEISNPVADTPSAVRGSGRGIKGMRRRAEALDGTLTAGPSGEGGWTVRASLPLVKPSGGGWTWMWAIDLLAVLLCAALPLLLIFAPDPKDEPVTRDAAGMLLLSALVVAHCVPLAWRRRSPWHALAGMLLVCLLWSAAVATELLSLESSYLWIFAWVSEAVLVYAIAAYARGRIAWVVAGLAGAMIALAVALVDPEVGSDERAVAAIFAFVLGWVVMSLLMLPFWIWGLVVRRRRDRADRWERDVLTAVATRTEEAVRNERHQMALGLRGEVLTHTSLLVQEAERPDGRLSEVATEGRAALAGMRKLLDVLDEAET
jgi:signal transduction histidine kinase